MSYQDSYHAQHQQQQRQQQQQQRQMQMPPEDAGAEEFYLQQERLKDYENAVCAILDKRTFLDYPIEFKVAVMFSGSLTDMQACVAKENNIMQMTVLEESIADELKPNPRHYLDEHHLSLGKVNVADLFSFDHLMVRDVTMVDVHNSTPHTISIQSTFEPMNTVTVPWSKNTSCAVLLPAKTSPQRCNEAIYDGEVAVGSSIVQKYAHTTLQEMFSKVNIDEHNRAYYVKRGTTTEQMVHDANEWNDMKLSYPFVLTKKQREEVRTHAYNSVYRFIPYLKKQSLKSSNSNGNSALMGFKAFIPTVQGAINGVFTDAMPNNPPLTPDELNEWHTFGATFKFRCVYPYSPQQLLVKRAAELKAKHPQSQ